MDVNLYWHSMIPDFPHFAPLSLDDKEAYERLIAEYPPFSDISFATLHIWWNLEDKLGVSILNDNLIINYHLTDDTKNSGYSIIGKSQLEASIETLFRQLERNGEPVRLVHVPEFVVKE